MATKPNRPRLVTLGSRVREVETRVKPQISSSSGWNRGDAPKRLTGRVLQRRNQRIKVAHHYTCAHCKRVTTELEIDHIVPLHLGGDESDSNMQPLCIGTDGCHAKKTKAERQAIGLG